MHYFLVLDAVRIQPVQAWTRAPRMSAHWRLGYFRFVVVGLYFPRSFLRTVTIPDVFPQISHMRGIVFEGYKIR